MWEELAEAAERESPLWAEALRPTGEREREPVFSRLADAAYAVAIETIYEGYLVHYGEARLFAPADAHTALLLGDYLYAHGLVRVAELGEVEPVGDLAELISLCAQLRGEGAEGDGVVWAATAALIGRGGLGEARAALRDGGDARPLLDLAERAAGAEAVESALVAHARRLR